MGKSKYKKIMVLLGFAIVILSALFFVKAAALEEYEEGSTEYNQGWYYMRDGEKIPISLPEEIQVEGEASFSIYNDQIASEAAGRYVYVDNAILRPEIYLDDTLLYQYNDGGLRRNPPELSYQICKGKIGDEVASGIVKITYHTSKDDSISLPEVHVSSEYTIIRHLFFSNAYITAITTTMCMLGIFVLVAGVLIMNQKYIDKRKLLMLGLFLLTIGTWCMTDSPLIQYLLGYSNLNMNTDFFIFMFIVIPFSAYVRCIAGMEKYKTLRGVIIAAFLNVIIQTVLALFDIFTYVQMVPATHVLIVAGVASAIFLLTKEYKINHKREVLLCLRAFAIAGFFSIVSIGIYFLKPELFYQNLLQTGLLLFVLILIWNLVSEFVRSFQYKVDATTYKQLAEVDKLTNLLNRRSFDMKLLEIEKAAQTYDNVLLVFLDVNGLKRINDVYGHARGDKAIEEVAQCIKQAYKDQKCCYRIGGDEFCVIMENPKLSEAEVIHILEQEVDAYNQMTEEELHFTIAVGCSFLKENNEIKNMVQWKEEADYKMYEDKKKKKFADKIIL